MVETAFGGCYLLKNLKNESSYGGSNNEVKTRRCVFCERRLQLLAVGLVFLFCHRGKRGP